MKPSLTTITADANTLLTHQYAQTGHKMTTTQLASYVKSQKLNIGARFLRILLYELDLAGDATYNKAKDLWTLTSQVTLYVNAVTGPYFQ